MLAGTTLYSPATENLSKFTKHQIVKAMNSLLHLQVEFTTPFLNYDGFDNTGSLIEKAG